MSQPDDQPSTRSAELLPAAAVQRFAELHPDQSGTFRHGLVGHPLLSAEALARAAARMDPATVQCRVGTSKNGEGFDFADNSARPATDVIERIAEARQWVMLAKLEQLPEYAAFFHEVMAPLEPLIRASGGAMLRLQAYAFVSSPHSLTPFHIDPEFNILFHLEGSKDFAVYPVAEPWLGPKTHEYYHTSGDNLLAWKDEYRTMGTIHRMRPGDAIYVPYKCPHWVEAGSEPAISLSLTWCTPASYDQEAAWRLNAWLARKGVNASPPPPLPARARARAFAWSAVERLGLA